MSVEKTSDRVQEDALTDENSDWGEKKQGKGFNKIKKAVRKRIKEERKSKKKHKRENKSKKRRGK